MDNNLTQAQLATNADTWSHIANVSKWITSFSQELTRRIFTHDQSKLVPPEVATFTKYGPKLKGSTYGSAEYKNNLKEMGSAIDHHYEHNRHHPEFFKDYTLPLELNHKKLEIEKHIDFLKYVKKNGFDAKDIDNNYEYLMLINYMEEHLKEVLAPINHMSLVDVVEMVCDFRAACDRHDDGDINKSIEINKTRFNMSSQLHQIIKNTVNQLSNNFSDLPETQKGL
jgi:hypothetical protein